MDFFLFLNREHICLVNQNIIRSLVSNFVCNNPGCLQTSITIDVTSDSARAHASKYG